MDCCALQSKNNRQGQLAKAHESPEMVAEFGFEESMTIPESLFFGNGTAAAKSAILEEFSSKAEEVWYRVTHNFDLSRVRSSLEKLFDWTIERLNRFVDEDEKSLPEGCFSTPSGCSSIKYNDPVGFKAKNHVFSSAETSKLLPTPAKAEMVGGSYLGKRSQGIPGGPEYSLVGCNSKLKYEASTHPNHIRGLKGTKRGRALTSKPLEEFLLSSIKLCPDQFVRSPRLFVKEKASIFKDRNDIKLMCSKGWLDKFLRRNRVAINIIINGLSSENNY